MVSVGIDLISFYVSGLNNYKGKESLSRVVEQYIFMYHPMVRLFWQLDIISHKINGKTTEKYRYNEENELLSVEYSAKSRSDM